LRDPLPRDDCLHTFFQRKARHILKWAKIVTPELDVSLYVAMHVNDTKWILADYLNWVHMHDESELRKLIEGGLHSSGRGSVISI